MMVDSESEYYDRSYNPAREELLDNRVYQLKAPREFTQYDYAEYVVGEYVNRKPCPQSESHSVTPRCVEYKSVSIELFGRQRSDFVWGGPTCIISERLREVLVRSGVRGFQCAPVKVTGYWAEQSSEKAPPVLHFLHIVGSCGVNVRYRRPVPPEKCPRCDRRVKCETCGYLEAIECPVCKYYPLVHSFGPFPPSDGNVIIDEERWDKTDMCRFDDTQNTLFVSVKIIELLRANNVVNYDILPALLKVQKRV
jgi:hypothetical protein